jgi:hypothetical protein
MDPHLDLLAQLEVYTQDARRQIGVDADQAQYWRGIVFGLELALLEARKRSPLPEGPSEPSKELYAAVSKLVFEHLDNLITLCKSPIKRDLLVYNGKVTRYELLRDIREAAAFHSPGNYEAQAMRDLGSSP